jgi:hypothetical protein
MAKHSDDPYAATGWNQHTWMSAWTSHKANMRDLRRGGDILARLHMPAIKLSASNKKTLYYL